MVIKATKPAPKSSDVVDDENDFNFPDEDDGVVHDDIDASAVDVDVEGEETAPRPKKAAIKEENEEEETPPKEEEEEEDDETGKEAGESDIEKEILKARLERAEGAINALTESLGKKAASENKSRIERALAIAKDDLKNAIENDDHAKQADLLMAVQELTVMKRDAEKEEKTIETVRERINPDIPAEAKKWLAKNPWFGKEAHKEKREFAKSQHALIESMGYEHTSPKYFEELDRRMKRQYPEMYKEKPRKQTSVTVGHVAQSSPKANAGKVTWDKKDAAIMRDYKLDPNNKDHRREWALTKAKIAAGNREFTFS